MLNEFFFFFFLFKIEMKKKKGRNKSLFFFFFFFFFFTIKGNGIYKARLIVSEEVFDKIKGVDYTCTYSLTIRNEIIFFLN